MIPWRNLLGRPGLFGVTNSCHSRWAKTGIWKHVYEGLAKDANKEYAMIDSTIVRAHQHCASAQKDGESHTIGRCKIGLITKIHATIDALGNSIRFDLTLGQANDLHETDELIPHLLADILVADKVNDAAESIIDVLENGEKLPIIPSKSSRLKPREYDRELFKALHLIEN